MRTPKHVAHPDDVRDPRDRKAFKEDLVKAIVGEVEATRERKAARKAKHVSVVDPLELPPPAPTHVRKAQDVTAVVRMAMRHPDRPELRAALDAMHDALVRLDAPRKMSPEALTYAAATDALRKSLTMQEVTARLSAARPARKRQLERALASIAEATRDSTLERAPSDEAVDLAQRYRGGGRGGRGVRSLAWLAALLMVDAHALGTRRRDGESLLAATDRVAERVRVAARDLGRKKPTGA